MGFSQEELKALKNEYASQATEEQFNIWMATCRERGLQPVTDVVLQIRNSQEFDPNTRTKVWKKKITFITTIVALRKIAERTGKYDGRDEPIYIYVEKDGSFKESTIPLPKEDNLTEIREPWAVRVSVKRKDFSKPVTVTARFASYAQYTNEGVLSSMWKTRGVEQLDKCGEALALREAFPEETGGLYVAEEFQRDSETEILPVVKQPVMVDSIPNPRIANVLEMPKVEVPALAPKKKGRPKGSLNEHTAEVISIDKAKAVEITDDDLPDFDKTPDNPDRFPTAEETKAYAFKAREYAIDKEALRNFILTNAGVDDPRDLTVGNWLSAFNELDAAGGQIPKETVTITEEMVKEAVEESKE